MDTTESFISDAVEQSPHSDSGPAAVLHPFRNMSQRNTSAGAETAFGVILMVIHLVLFLVALSDHRVVRAGELLPKVVIATVGRQFFS